MKKSYNTDVNCLVKKHEVAGGIQISKKPTYTISCA